MRHFLETSKLGWLHVTPHGARRSLDDNRPVPSRVAAWSFQRVNTQLSFQPRDAPPHPFDLHIIIMPVYVNLSLVMIVSLTTYRRPGDQHRGIANPFEDEKPRVSEWTAKEIATLQSRLEKQLGPEYISSRKGPGNRTLYYLPAEKAINLANEVFGFNGWSSSIRDVQIDFVWICEITGDNAKDAELTLHAGRSSPVYWQDQLGTECHHTSDAEGWHIP